MVAPLVARDEPERGQDAGRVGNEHGLDPELLRQLARVQRPRATERDEREPARIVPALDRNEPQGAQHLRVHRGDHRRGVDSVKGALGRRPVELDARLRAARAAGRAAGSRR